MKRTQRTRICPCCCCELPAEEFLTPEDLAVLEAARAADGEPLVRLPTRPRGEIDLLDEVGEEDLDLLLELVVEVLLAHGLGETFDDWRGEVVVPRPGSAPELVLSGRGRRRPSPRRRRNGRLVIAASLEHGPRRQPSGRDDGDDE